MNWKVALAAAIVAAVVIAGALAFRGGEGEEERPTLKILNYSEYIDPEVLTLFEEKYGVNIVLDEYESAEEAWAKLKAGASYDLVILAHSYVGLAVKNGLIQPLNKSLIPNLALLDERVASHPADPRQDYAVPYMWGTTGVAYVSSCVPNPPATWREFLDPDYLSQYSGKVSLLSEFSETVMAAMIALGYDPSVRENWNQQVMAEVESLLLSVKDHLAGFYGASEYMPALNESIVCIAQAWSGDILVVQDANPDVEFINPEDGALYWVDYMVIPKNAEHVKLAHELINFLLEPEIAAKNVKYVWYAASIKKSLLLQVAEEQNDTDLMEILENPLVYPPDDVKLIPSPVLDEEMSSMVETVRLHVLGG